MTRSIFFLILLVANLFGNFASASYEFEPQITLYKKNGDQTEIFGSDCGAGVYFPTHHMYSCACLTGVWAIYRHWCTAPVSIVAGEDFCFDLPNEKLKQISLLSSTNVAFESTIVRMTASLEQMLEKYDHNANVFWDTTKSSFITIGNASWELETAQGKSYCLIHTQPNEICHFPPFYAKPIRRIRRGCQSHKIMHPEHCSPIKRGETEGKSCLYPGETFDDKHLKMEYQISGRRPHFEHSERKSRSKRNATNPAPAQPPPPEALEDEDFIDPAQLAVKSSPVIMDQLKNYLDSKINELTGATPQFSTDKRFPALDLLEQSAAVMEKTCSVVSSDHFKMALNAFINIQTNSLHLKEPYISEPAFERIKTALGNCVKDAQAHSFQIDSPTVTTPTSQPGTSTNSLSNCDGDLPPNATHTILKDFLLVNFNVEPWNFGAGFEPIIETVWKMVLNAHMYCYKKFSDFYNDHHTFTVTMLSFFTNEIQNLWMNSTLNGTYEEPAAGGRLYGGLIGDHVNLLSNIDLCVAAGKIGSAYPWLMSRPPRDESNKWLRRRRRSTMVSHGQVCLTSPTDIYAKVNHPRCE